MRNVFDLLKRNAYARAFLLFSLLFYTSMWISKTVHPLWFHENHATVLFGLSYTMMAIAGTLSFLTGFLADKLGARNAVKFGVFVYSVGLCLRVFTHSYVIAALSGFIAGIGASLVIVCLKSWMMNLGKEDERPAAVALNNMCSTLGASIGAFLAGVLASAFSFLGTPTLPVILVVASVLCFLTILFVPKFEMDTRFTTKDIPDEKRLLVVFKSNPYLTVGTIFFGALAGLVVSGFTPYLPLLLQSFGFSLTQVGIMIAVTTALRAASSPFAGAKYIERNKTALFFISEGIMGISVILLAIGLHKWFVVFVLLVRSILLNVSVNTEQIIELSMFPREYMSFYFGLLQSGFFIGDALGGSVAGVFYQYGLKTVLVMTGGLTLLNAIWLPLFYLFSRKPLKRGFNHEGIM